MSLTSTPTKAALRFRSVIARGLLAGLIAGIIAGTVGFLAGERLIDQAIALESTASASHNHELGSAESTAVEEEHSREEGEAPLVSRDGQRAGLILATTLTGGATGVIFAVVWFVASRRFTKGPVPGVLRLALAGWTAVVAVPFVIIPPNPPALGSPESIDQRTSIWLMAVILGLAAVTIGYLIHRWTEAQELSSLIVNVVPLLSGLIIVLSGWFMMPRTETDYTGFPADLLWNFRLAAAATQLALWLCLGVAFHYFMERVTRPRSSL